MPHEQAALSVGTTPPGSTTGKPFNPWLRQMENARRDRLPRRQPVAKTGPAAGGGGQHPVVGRKTAI
jgi:hypothetical protein